MKRSPEEISRRCDATDMIAIHNLFRRLLAGAPALIRAVPDGDRARASVVADHVNEVAISLHNHHHGEDLFVWDDLSARAPTCAIHVEHMKAQHAAVAILLDELTAALPDWRRTAGAHERERVASAVEVVLSTLLVHLGEEETEILPVAARSFTQPEWDRLAAHGMAAIPAKRRFIQLGYILDGMPAEERAAWIKHHVPGPARLLFRMTGRRQIAANQRLLYSRDT
jgi:hemerythrin-like domain-containing protein